MSKKPYGVIVLGACAVAATIIALPQAQAVPPLKKPVTKTVAVPSLNSDRLLSPAEKLSLLQVQAKAANVEPPAGLYGSVRLSARNLFASGAADLTPHCALSVDQVKDEIVPSVWQLAGTYPATSCLGFHKQGLTLRFNTTKPKQGVLVAVAFNAKTSGHFSWAAPPHLGVSKPKSFPPGSHVFHVVFIPKQAGWFTAELRLGQGDVTIRGIQIN